MTESAVRTVARSEIRPQVDGFDLLLQGQRMRTDRLWAAVLGVWLCGWFIGYGAMGWILWRVLAGLPLHLPPDMAVEVTTRPAERLSFSDIWPALMFFGMGLWVWTWGGIEAMRGIRFLLRPQMRYEFRRDGIRRPRTALWLRNRVGWQKNYSLSLEGPGEVRVYETGGAWRVVCSVPGDVVEIGSFREEADARQLMREIGRWYSGLQMMAGGR